MIVVWRHTDNSARKPKFQQLIKTVTCRLSPQLNLFVVKNRFCFNFLPKQILCYFILSFRNYRPTAIYTMKTFATQFVFQFIWTRFQLIDDNRFEQSQNFDRKSSNKIELHSLIKIKYQFWLPKAFIIIIETTSATLSIDIIRLTYHTNFNE